VTEPADGVLQAERTALSWRRTALAVTIGSLVGLRVLPVHVGLLGYVFCLLGLAWGADLALTAAHRYHQADRHLRTGRTGDGPGAPVYRTAVMTAAIGVAALVAVTLWADIA
jgi:uncharacterized membrane protein YidH (DUF202 family)